MADRQQQVKVDIYYPLSRGSNITESPKSQICGEMNFSVLTNVASPLFKAAPNCPSCVYIGRCVLLCNPELTFCHCLKMILKLPRTVIFYKSIC